MSSSARGRRRTRRRRPRRPDSKGPRGMLTPAQAETLIEQHLVCLPIESLPLTQVAGAVLRENVYAERDQPPFDRVAMDGIALSTSGALASTGRLRVAGMQAAGDPPHTLADAADCIEIM